MFQALGDWLVSQSHPMFMQSTKQPNNRTLIKYKIEKEIFYGQLILGLNGMNMPDGLFSNIQACRLQCGAGTGVPPSSNG